MQTSFQYLFCSLDICLYFIIENNIANIILPSLLLLLSHIVINLLCSFSNLLLVKFYFHVILEINYKFLLHFIYHLEYVRMCAYVSKYICVCVCPCSMMSVSGTEITCELSFLLLCGSWGLNSGRWVCLYPLSHPTSPTF